VDNRALFIIGLVVTLPTSFVVLALIFATGSDQRELDRQKDDVEARAAASG
jgi:hypothetical protein